MIFDENDQIGIDSFLLWMNINLDNRDHYRDRDRILRNEVEAIFYKNLLIDHLNPLSDQMNPLYDHRMNPLSDQMNPLYDHHMNPLCDQVNPLCDHRTNPLFDQVNLWNDREENAIDLDAILLLLLVILILRFLKKIWFLIFSRFLKIQISSFSFYLSRFSFSSLLVVL